MGTILRLPAEHGNRSSWPCPTAAHGTSHNFMGPTEKRTAKRVPTRMWFAYLSSVGGDERPNMHHLLKRRGCHCHAVDGVHVCMCASEFESLNLLRGLSHKVGRNLGERKIIMLPCTYTPFVCTRLSHRSTRSDAAVEMRAKAAYVAHCCRVKQSSNLRSLCGR